MLLRQLTYVLSLGTLLSDLLQSLVDCLMAGFLVIHDTQDLRDSESIHNQANDARSHGWVDSLDRPEDQVSKVLSLSTLVTLSYD